MLPNKLNFPPTWNYLNESHKLERFNDLVLPAYNEVHVFEQFRKSCNLKGAKVLEVGGSMPLSIIEEEKVKYWESYNTMSSVDDTENPVYKLFRTDFTKISCNAEFDIVFSSNALHHINPLESCLENIYNSLLHGGIAYLHFGPIWSAPDGHHLDVVHNGIVYRFDGISLFTKWQHLLCDAAELKAFLAPKIGNELAQTCVQYIYESPYLNRNFYEDYIDLINKSGFSILHLSTSNTIDYEYHNPDRDSIDTIDTLNKLYQKYGRRNYFTRDILVVLLKP